MRLIDADELIERIKGPCTKEQIIGMIHTSPTVGITPESFEQTMRRIADDKDYDEEVNHNWADLVLCDALKMLGYEKGVAIFKDLPKWYA